MIKAIVFDLDDTLISEKEYIKSGFKQVANKIAKENNLDEKSIYELIMDTFDEDSKNVFNRVLDKLGIQYEIEYIKELINYYRNHMPNIKLYNDAKYILDTLKNKGIKLGMITDGYKITQRNKLEVLNISDYFEYIVVTDELGREFWKPHQKPYEIIKQNLNVEYENMVYVGDNISKDFITPNKLGMNTILINREEGIYSGVQMGDEYLAKLKVKSLLDLEEILNI